MPLVYEIATNVTQLPEKREALQAPGLIEAYQILKHFAQYQHTQCSLYPAVRELLMTLVFNSEQQHPNPGGVPQMQSPAMQMPQGGQTGYPVNMPMGMMGPQ